MAATAAGRTVLPRAEPRGSGRAAERCRGPRAGGPAYYRCASKKTPPTKNHRKNPTFPLKTKQTIDTKHLDLAVKDAGAKFRRPTPLHSTHKGTGGSFPPPQTPLQALTGPARRFPGSHLRLNFVLALKTRASLPQPFKRRG